MVFPSVEFAVFFPPVLLLDWEHYSSDHMSWFGPDEVHLSIEGARAFAEFLHARTARASR